MSKHVLDILKELKAQVGKGSMERKMAILEEHRNNKFLKDFFYWVLDSNINYWQSKINKKITYDVEPMNFKEVMDEIFAYLVPRKVTGNKAVQYLTEYYYSLRDPKDRILLERIITRKPDVGFSVSTINKVWPGLIYDPAYMRCKGYSPAMVQANKTRDAWDFESEVIYSNLKADGMFDNIILGDTLEFETRAGEKLPVVVQNLSIEHIQPLTGIRDFLQSEGVVNPVLHGEFLVINSKGEVMERSKGNGLINKVKLGGSFPANHYLRIVVWDYIPLENYLSHEGYEVTYDIKFQKLIEALNCSDSVQLIEYRRVYSQMEAQAHFVECLQKGYEGTVLKNASRLTWKNHDSPNQLKLKNKFRFEMRVTGFTTGEGKFALTFGSMEIISECGLLKSSISGMKDKLRKKINADRSNYLGAIVEVEANGLFKNDDGSYGLMHPVFKELRSDKTEADTLERIIQQEIDSIMGKEISSGV